MRTTSVAVLGMVGIALIVIGAVVSWQRTLIPGSLDGEIRNVVSYEVDQPGVDDWVSLSINDREITTGNDALVCLREDSTVAKTAFSRRTQVDGAQCELPFPRQAVTDTVVPLLLAGILAFCLRPRRP